MVVHGRGLEVLTHSLVSDGVILCDAVYGR